MSGKMLRAGLDTGYWPPRKSRQQASLANGVPCVSFHTAAAILIVLLLGFAGNAYAQDHQYHHPFHMEFYRHWKNPVTGASCCNARIEVDGHETGDCEPTKAEVRNGSWWVWIRQIGQWQQVPDIRVIRERNPNIFDAHLCWTPLQGIMCFSPPDTGG